MVEDGLTRCRCDGLPKCVLRDGHTHGRVNTSLCTWLIDGKGKVAIQIIGDAAAVVMGDGGEGCGQGRERHYDSRARIVTKNQKL